MIWLRFILIISWGWNYDIGQPVCSSEGSGEESISGPLRLFVKVSFSHSGCKIDACFWWVESPQVSRQCLHTISKPAALEQPHTQPFFFFLMYPFSLNSCAWSLDSGFKNSYDQVKLIQVIADLNVNWLETLITSTKLWSLACYLIWFINSRDTLGETTHRCGQPGVILEIYLEKHPGHLGKSMTWVEPYNWVQDQALLSTLE